jgi:hypothetical protein
MSEYTRNWEGVIQLSNKSQYSIVGTRYHIFLLLLLQKQVKPNSKSFQNI